MRLGKVLALTLRWSVLWVFLAACASTPPEGESLPLAELAAQGQDAELVKRLQAGEAADAGAEAGRDSALLVYAAAGNTRMVRVLLQAGADMEYRNEAGKTALALALEKGRLPTAKALINAGADVNLVFAERSLLMHSVSANSLLMAQVLMDAGVNVNYRSPQGETALNIAQKQGYSDLQMLLMQSGAQE